MLAARGLRYYWRTHLAVMLGVAAATAALTGALLVGDSMRASLREAALSRLGRVGYAVTAPRFFREALAEECAAGTDRATAPAILLRGAASHAVTQARAGAVQILGVDERFWRLARAGLSPSMEDQRDVWLNEPLARELGARAGDDVLVRLGKPSAVSTESLLGRRDDTAMTLRLTVHEVIAADGLGSFGLSLRQSVPYNAFVPLTVLQRAIDRSERANLILIAEERPDDGDLLRAVEESLRGHVTLADFGLRFRFDEAHAYAALESDSFLIEPVFEAAAIEAARATRREASRVLTYLANEIAVVRSADEPDTPHTTTGINPAARQALIPYSTVAAIDARTAGLLDNAGPLNAGEILLNDWAAEDLGAKVGDRVRLAYYVTGPFGQLRTEHADFVVRSVVELEGGAADPGFTPVYPGVTNTKRISDWDPPFPVDLTKVRDQDEAYWEAHRATPKAFIALDDGVRLWAHEADRLGRLTSLRVYAVEGADLATQAREFEQALLANIDVAKAGMIVEPVRARALAASAGNTDFGGLFIGFSFCLILAALMLVALLFRLGIERRAREIGLLLAVGFAPRRVARLLILEGGLIALFGVVIGLAGAMGYGWLMLAGLRSWWSEAVSAPFLRLHATPATLALGAGIALIMSTASIAWSIRGLTRKSPRALLSGGSGDDARREGGRAARPIAWIGLGLALLMAVLGFATDWLPQAPAFFGSGAAMLVACLGAVAHFLGRSPRRVIGEAGGRSLTRLGIRNAPRHRGRSLLTVALVASSAFVILALEAFRLQPAGDPRERRSGTGGFGLVAESAAPMPYDPGTRSGRESLNMPSAAAPEIEAAAVVPFRLRPGDETSCLNLYQSSKPRVLGASEAMIDRGGFVFAGSLTETAAERENPWMLLSRTFPDGAVAAIGDEAAVRWQLHSGLGRDLVITDERGGEVRLRFVALLSGSVLQSELIVAEDSFKRLFPSVEGYGFFLIDAPPESVAAVEGIVERELSPFGFDANPTRDRLAGYLAVQDTYLSTFQALGGLGLVLGVIGLSAVLLRNVLERRRELALMRAVGFSRPALGRMVLAENLVLVAAGLAVGVVSAAVAVAPHLATRARDLPWASVGALLVAVFAAGLVAGVVALVPTLRAPLVPALRSE